MVDRVTNHLDQTVKPFTNGRIDATPSGSRETTGISLGQSNSKTPCSVDKSTQRYGSSDGSRFASNSVSLSQPSSRLSTSSSTSSRVSNQVRQTVRTLIYDLVFNAESPDVLDSCANACRTYHLDLSALLQDRFIEQHSPLYWAILNGRDTLLQSLLVHASLLSKEARSDIRLACLVTGNQHLFQSLRCRPGASRRELELIPLSTNCRADALLLGSVPADEVSIREIEGQWGFIAEMRINLWQKRMRALGAVNVEFIARGRIWSLAFASPSNCNVMGVWRIELRLHEHSPPTFINSRLVIDPAPSPSGSLTPASQVEELISLSSSPNDLSSLAAQSPPSCSPIPSNQSECDEPKTIEFNINSKHRLAYSNTDKHEQWTAADQKTYTNGIVVPLSEGAGVELMYDNTPFLGTDGALHARFKARLENPAECVRA